MKRKRYTDEQIAYALRQADASWCGICRMCHPGACWHDPNHRSTGTRRIILARTALDGSTMSPGNTTTRRETQNHGKSIAQRGHAPLGHFRR